MSHMILDCTQQFTQVHCRQCSLPAIPADIFQKSIYAGV